MLGIDQRAFKVFWTLFLFGFTLFILYRIATTLIVFALGLFLAQLLSPVVDLVERLLPNRFRRILAISIVYLALVGGIVAVAIPVGSNIAQQAVVLAERLPEALKSNPLSRIRLPAWLEPERESIGEYLSGSLQQLGTYVVPSVSRAGRQIVTGLGSVLRAVLVPIVGFIFLTSGEELRRALVSMFDSRTQSTVAGILEDLHYLISHYIRALILLSAATFIAFSIFLAIVGAPYGVLLAGFAAALEVIPVIGPLTAAVSIVIVAALSGFQHIVAIVVFLACYRLFQDYVLSPYLMGTGVDMPPLMVLFGVLAGEQLAGVPGMFFSVPVIAAIRLLLVRFRRPHVE